MPQLWVSPLSYLLDRVPSASKKELCDRSKLFGFSPNQMVFICPYGALLDPCTIGARKSFFLTRVAQFLGTADGSHGGCTAAETALESP